MELEEGDLTEATGSLKSESVSTITVGVVDEQRKRETEVNSIYFSIMSLNQQNRGVWELCWNNFGNNDGAKESRIIPEF